MNDRAVSILENYDFAVLRTYKGRGAILCETNQGLKILKEYHSPVVKAELLSVILPQIADKTDFLVDTFVSNKEGKMISYDRDANAYVVKDYYQGRECSPKDMEDLKIAVRSLGILHEAMSFPQIEVPQRMRIIRFDEEVKRHNRELKRIRSFVRGRHRKNDFELYLLGCYETFYEQAQNVEEALHKEDFEDFYLNIEQKKTFAHGEYQYHNILFAADKLAFVNFEKCQWDTVVRDLALFLRKTLEKTDWSYEIGSRLLTEYENVRKLSEKEKMQLALRLSYPEKFRKIANFYYNSNKAFISSQFPEKLQNVMRQEEARQFFLHKVFQNEL